MESNEIVTLAYHLTIASAEDNGRAAEIAKELKRFQVEIEASYRPIVDAAHKAHKAALDELKAKLQPFEAAEKAVKAGMLAWAKQERERLAEEERKRQEAERKRREEEALAEAELLSTLGDAAGADAVMEAPIIVQAEVVAAPEKVAGVTVREVWSGECFDLLALARAVGEGKASPDLLMVNGPELNKMARAMKHALAIPGCRATVAEVMGVQA